MAGKGANETIPQVVSSVQTSESPENADAGTITFSSKRRERGDSGALQPSQQPSVAFSELDIKSSKRHRFDSNGPTDEENSALKSIIGPDLESDSDSGDGDFDHNNNNNDNDPDVNIDGSCAPSPFSGSDLGADAVEHIPFTRFTSEQIEIIRSEAHTLGMGAFLQHYLGEKSVPIRALLEAFGAPSTLCASVADFQLLPLLKNQLLRFYRNRPRLKHISTVNDVVNLLKNSQRIMVLTGAGVSVSCGIPDFRSPTGIYTRLNDEFGLDDPQQMFDIEYFRETPELFFSFAKELYPYNFTPAPTHAFVKLLEDKGKLLRNYTQNIDTLEHVQGIRNVLNCHGSFATATCIKCEYKCDGKELESDIMAMRIAYCPKCNDRPTNSSETLSGEEKQNMTQSITLLANPVFDESNNDSDSDDDDYGSIKGIMKPDITFFGEKLPDQFDEALLEDRDKVDLLLVMGSSLKVAPVSDIMSHLPHNVPQIVINKTPILHLNFDVQLLGDADDIVAYLARACGWDLKHPRIPGGSTESRDYVCAGPTPIVEPPSMAIPIKVSKQNPDVDEVQSEVMEKVYKVPEHWHLFTSAVVTAKDLYIASGDAQVRLAVDSSDEDDVSDISSCETGNEGSDDKEEEENGDKVNQSPTINEEGNELAKEMTDASI
ncbi:NAD-dependent histone deacetylase sir2 [Coemansia asiatica]|uniref:NAD-dependent histone deacetylase sir2 n=1 Tax=Coemansia asiatica TaxID=1052880 RepID=A0A9W7XRJ2_9FUNG|nr:NAD-dependent histone deacetylase sir2 [Coemansia asiatica]